MKTLNKIIGLILLISFLSLLNSCASISLMDDPELAESQVKEWENKILQYPNDVEALKNLSIYYVQTHQNEKAKSYLNRALKKAPDDPALLFYKGLNLEFFNKQSEAFKYYERFTSLPEETQYRELMEGRYLWLKRQQAYSDIDSLIKKENEISFAEASDSTMAVFPLIYQGTNKDYFPLSRGFSEMVSIDLAKVKQLTILERIRIQAVLDEIKFGESSLVDQSTAPRAGKLLRAGTIVSGDYDISEEGDFKINLGSWDVQTSTRKSWVNKSGDLKDLFILQKEVVFAFLQNNGIELTQAEKEEIAYIPTQNLESFLAYSKGLLQEDAGDFKEAESFYQQAVELDPHFNAADDKVETTQSIGKSSGTKEQLITQLRTNDPIIKGEASSLENNRRQSLVNNITSNFIQGVDSRSPAQEGGYIESLPSPPPPPPIE